MNLELLRMTPRLKYYAVKYHCFRACLKPENLRALKVESKQQSADIFTKGLRKNTFANIELLMGWLTSGLCKYIKSLIEEFFGVLTDYSIVRIARILK